MAHDDNTTQADQAPDAPPEVEATEAVAPAAPAPAPEQLSPKEARARARRDGEARAPRTPEERQAERRAERAAKARVRSAQRVKDRARRSARRAAAPAVEPPAPVHAAVEGRRKVRQGIVVADKADKTITVRVDVARRHRRYSKIVRRSTTLHVHDEQNDAHLGDTVRVVESRPLSRTKRWRLVDVLERAQ